MNYIISNQQYKLITEALGVPESILDAAEDFYDIFLDKIKSIKTKKNQYDFQGYVDITLGDKDKIYIRQYDLLIEVNQIDEFKDSPKIYSMGMNQSFTFDRNIMMKKTSYSTEAEFIISFAVGTKWKPQELYEEFLKNREDNISSLAHELKHKYDKQIKKIDLIGKEAEYAGVQKSPRFQIDVIDRQFLHYLYYTDIAESLVRPTEVASRLRSRNISQEEFREFLSNDRTFKDLIKIKNFTFNDLREGILKEMDRVDQLIRFMNQNPETMTDDEKVEKILTLVYINLTNTKFNQFDQMITNPMEGLFGLFSAFGSLLTPEQIKVDKLREKFYNYLLRYKNNPIEYFKAEIEKFHYVANQMIKKLGKLYAMTSKKVFESIIDWDLNEIVREEKGMNNPIEFNFRKFK